MKKIKNNTMNNRLFLLKIILLIFVFSVIAIILKRGIGTQFISDKSIRYYADSIIEKCKKYTNSEQCYNKEIPKLIEKISMIDAFRVTVEVQKDDKSFTYCHILSHELSAKAVDKDPSNWIEIASQCPLDMCGNGCQHGAFQEHFRNYGNAGKSEIDDAIPALKQICEKRKGWEPTELGHFSCYHAIGHITMYLTDADVKKSIDICSQVAVGKNNGKDYTQTCYEGVFMQLYQPRGPEDIALVKEKQPIQKTVAKYCEQFNDKAKNACWRESWTLNQDEIKTPQGIIKFCSYDTSPVAQETCYDKFFQMIGIILQKIDKKTLTDFCLKTPSALQDKCFRSVVASITNIDENNVDMAIDICTESAKKKIGTSCFDMLAYQATYIFKKGSYDSIKMCNKLPDNWKGRCLSEK